MTREIIFKVQDFPPIKNEAKSLLAEGHRQRPKVIALLQAANDEIMKTEFAPFDTTETLVLEVVLHAEKKGDATNYLGGIGDTLQDKSCLERQCPGMLKHLGNLASVFVYPSDSQICEVHYRQEPGNEARYTVRVWSR